MSKRNVRKYFGNETKYCAKRTPIASTPLLTLLLRGQRLPLDFSSFPFLKSIIYLHLQTDKTTNDQYGLSVRSSDRRLTIRFCLSVTCKHRLTKFTLKVQGGDATLIIRQRFFKFSFIQVASPYKSDHLKRIVVILAMHGQ